MEKLTILITVILSMVACTSNTSPEFSHGVGNSTSLTRSYEECDELTNSSLLNALAAYNDSLAINAVITPNTNSPVISNQLERVSICDVLGYVIGYEIAKGVGLNRQNVERFANIYSFLSSLSAAIEIIAPHLPSLSGTTFESHANIYSAVINAPNYSDLAAQQYQMLGDMTMFSNY